MISETHRSTPAFAIGGITPAFRCIGCGAETNGYHFLQTRGICARCCYDHDYEYDRYVGRSLCIHCDGERDPDYVD